LGGALKEKQFDLHVKLASSIIVVIIYMILLLLCVVWIAPQASSDPFDGHEMVTFLLTL